MFLDLHKIPEDGVRLDEALRLAPLEGPSGEAIAVSDVRLRGLAERGERGIELRAHLDALVQVTCSRCLEPVPRRVSEDVHLTLVAAPEAETGAGEIEVTDEDASVYACPEGKAGLEELVTEQLYLDLPLKTLCDEGCKGLCPECGANRNRTRCDCRREEVDPRLAPLLRFKRSGS